VLRFAGLLLILSAASPAVAGSRTIEFRPAPGGTLVGVAGESAVVRNGGGPIAAFDLGTGKRLRVLVPAPRTGNPSAEGAIIDSFAHGSTLLHGALVGPSGEWLTAIDVTGGQTRWRIRPASGRTGDLDLRDTFQGVAVGALDILGIGLVQHTKSLWRLEESVLAVDPATGQEQWRRLVEQHRDPSTTSEQTMHLAADATQVLAITGTKVVALDAANGAEKWQQDFATPAPRLQVHPFALDSGRLAIASQTGFVQVFGTEKGDLQSEIALPSGAQVKHLAQSSQVLLAALEQASPSGLTSLAAFSLPSGKPTWSVKMPSAVTYLSVAGRAAYLASMDQRIRSFDLLTGKERWSSAGGGNFLLAPAPEHPERLVHSSGVVLPVPGGAAPLHEPYLRFDFAKAGQGDCQATQVSWLDGADRVVWTADLPKRMRAMSRASCAHEVASYVHSPRQNRHQLYHLMGVLEQDGEIFIADPTGVLALAQASGKRLLDLALPDTGKHTIAFDAGDFVLDGKPACKGAAGRARVFQRCQDRILYFAGNRAALLKRNPPRVEALGTYQGGSERVQSMTYRYSLKLGNGMLTLTGMSYRD
jgi:outer membrane protein assembly factor BamB